MKTMLTLALMVVVIACSAQKADIESNNGVNRIVIGETVLEVDANVGGRITALTFEGKNFLTGREVHPDYWGSSLWPSPQRDWGGSLPAELDTEPYTVEVREQVISMVSRKDKKFGYVFAKEIFGDKKNNCFSIKYTITNQSGEMRKVAPWEVTRVHTKGLAFYPKGTGERRGSLATFAEDINDITWFIYDEKKIPATHNKFFADGSEGWVAQLNAELLLIKQFEDNAEDKAAPGESEIEVYTNAAKTYVEIEQQGSYQTLQPGESLVWQVKWYLRKLPVNIDGAKGNATLVSYVRQIIKQF